MTKEEIDNLVLYIKENITPHDLGEQFVLNEVIRVIKEFHNSLFVKGAYL